MRENPLSASVLRIQSLQPGAGVYPDICAQRERNTGKSRDASPYGMDYLN